MRTIAVLSLALPLLACLDAAEVRDAAVTDAGLTSTPVEIPWLAAGEPPVVRPALTPCPKGWHAVDDPVLPATCDPSPAGGTPTCSPFEIVVPGAATCTPVGTACPADGLPAALPADRTIRYVLSGAARGGDGSRARPHAHLAEALALATPGTIVAVGRGTYDEAVTVPAGVTLHGACVAETVIIATTPADRAGVITVGGAGVEIRNLRIGESPRWGIVIPPSARSARVEDVVVERSTGLGLTVANGRLDARRLIVRQTRLGPGHPHGYAIDAELGAVVHLEQSMLERNAGSALFAAGPGSRIETVDVLVRGGNRGISLQHSAEAHLVRMVVEGVEDIGMSVLVGSSLVARDIVIRDVAPDALGRYGRGIQVQSSTLDLARATIERATEVAIVASQPETRVTVADVVIRDIRPDTTSGRGRALHVQTGAELTAERVAIARGYDAAVTVSLGARATITDLFSHDIRVGGHESIDGRAIQVQDGSSAEIRRAILDRATGIGAAAHGHGTRLLLEDALLRRTEPEPVHLRAGHGIAVVDGAAGIARRVVVDESHESGIVAYGNGTFDLPSTITLEDVVIRRSLPAACSRTTCTDARFGHGLTVAFSALTATRFAVLDSDLCGLFLLQPAQVHVDLGRVARAAIGVCVQEAPGLDPVTLAEGLTFEDTATAFQFTDLPAPEPGRSLDALIE